MRFFHRFGSLNYNFLGLVNGILLKAARKKKYTSVIEYIEKYSYVLNEIKIKETSDKYPNKIWQLWLQGKENMPSLVKKCHETVKFFHGNDVILLDKNNLNEYIQLPEYIEEKYKQGIITNANYSDLIRLSLLAKYGGCWVDSTIYLTDRIPDVILNSEFFSFKSLGSENLKFIENLENYKLFANHINKFLSIESPYFLASASGNILINAVLNLFLEYWKHETKLIDYLMIDKMFVLAVLKQAECARIFKSMPAYYLENVLLLQNALFEPFDIKVFEQIKQMSCIHKLTHKNLHRNPYKDSFFMKLLNADIKDLCK